MTLVLLVRFCARSDAVRNCHMTDNFSIKNSFVDGRPVYLDMQVSSEYSFIVQKLTFVVDFTYLFSLTRYSWFTVRMGGNTFVHASCSLRLLWTLVFLTK